MRNKGISKYPELQGLSRSEYRNAWNKLHRDIMREVSRRFRKTPKGKISARKFRVLARGTPAHKRRRRDYNKRTNDKSRQLATMSGERWGPVEDAMIFSGIPQSRLVKELGRSILAIQQRKIRIRKSESEQ